MSLLVGGPLLSEASAEGRAQPVLIGALNSSWGPTPYEAGLRDGLRELGYRENEDFVMGVRFTQGDLTALAGAARQLVAAGANVMVVDHDDAAKAALQASQHIPIVSTSLSDPVAQGLIESLAKPGGNLTGISDLHLELGPKRVEVFRAMVPGLQRVLFLYSAKEVYAASEAKTLSAAAERLGVELVARAVSTEKQAQAILAELRRRRIDGVIAPRCCALNLPELILQAATKLRLPMMYESAFWVERGALASYGPDLHASGRMAARQVDKIIRGSSPAQIPVEINRDVEFVINLRTARALGLTLAPEIIYR